MDMRRQLAEILRSGDHTVILMEDEQDVEGQDLVQKFYRLLRDRAITDILVYWPAHAKMPTTHDELILLRAMYAHRDPSELPALWILHHVSVASITKDKFEVKEKGGRSRYLTAVARLGTRPLEWEDDQDLLERARLLSMELRHSLSRERDEIRRAASDSAIPSDAPRALRSGHRSSLGER